MARTNRIRRIAKWAGAGLCVLILAGWALSLGYDVGFPLGQPHTLWLMGGQIELSHTPNIYKVLVKRGYPAILKHKNWLAPELRWPRYRENTFGNWWADMPLWVVLLLAASSTGILFHRDRHGILPGHCGACGYDLTGNVSGVCPECGSSIAARPSRLGTNA